MIEIGYFIITSLLTWVGGFYLHELFHKWEAEAQGCTAEIELWNHKGIPSMYCTYHGTLADRSRFLLMGGLGSGLVLLLLSIALYNYWWAFVPVFTVGLINLSYSYYEMKYRPILTLNDYMKWHYILYLIVGVLGLVLSLYMTF